MLTLVSLVARSTAGLEVECDFGFYNPTYNANNQTACIKCPERSTTQAMASTRADECVCEKSFFDADGGAGVACELCVSGTNCSRVGTTLAQPAAPARLLPTAAVDDRRASVSRLRDQLQQRRRMSPLHIGLPRHRLERGRQRLA